MGINGVPTHGVYIPSYCLELLVESSCCKRADSGVCNIPDQR